VFFVPSLCALCVKIAWLQLPSNEFFNFAQNDNPTLAFDVFVNSNEKPGLFKTQTLSALASGGIFSFRNQQSDSCGAGAVSG
jgi:hypothetical protein